MFYSRCNVMGFRLLLAVVLLLATWQALTPAPVAPAGLNDKLMHLLGFVVLAFLVDIAWPEAGFDWRPIAWLAAYGALIEGLQALTATRQAELGDWLADLAGLLLFAVVLAPPLRRRFGVRSEADEPAG